MSLTENDDIPWAMQIVVRQEKQHTARQVDICEATARAVVTLLDDERSQPGGPWYPSVKHWNDGRIRKLVRRARGKRWDDVQELDGITITQDGPVDAENSRGSGSPRDSDGSNGSDGSSNLDSPSNPDAMTVFGPAQARAFVPCPERPLPKMLDKLQVAGTHFPDEGTSLSRDALVVIEVSPLIEITSGKLAAQCGHAAQITYQEASPAQRDRWRADGFRVQVVFPDHDSWQTHRRPVSIMDAGFTEFHHQITETTRAYWAD